MMVINLFFKLLVVAVVGRCSISPFLLFPNSDYIKSYVQNSREYLNDVVLNHELPPIFVVGESFRVQGYAKERKVKRYREKNRQFGKVENDEYPVTVFFLNKWTKQKEFYFTQKLPYGQSNFSIQCYLDEPGKYYIGIFVGLTGVYYPKVYQIKKAPMGGEFAPALNIAPTNLSLSVQNNQLLVRWQKKTPLTLIMFNQSQNQINFTVSNDKGIFKIPYSMFDGFEEGDIQICIMHADSQDLGAYRRNSSFSSPLIKNIKATQHHFQQVRKNKVQIQGELPSKASINETVQIKGSWKQYLSTRVYVLEPGNYIRLLRLQIDFWRKTFQVDMKVKKEGVYIIEINHHKGYAVVNTPLYVGEGYPVLPDFEDMTPEIVDIVEINKHIPVSLEQRRKYILDLINQKRQEFDAPSIEQDAELTKLAQQHSNEMATHRYVSHKNRRNLSSKQRARMMGITTEVKENIASCYSIDYCQNGLNRSPAHLMNIVKERWARVGLGIAQDENQVFYITQQFSTIDPKRKKQAKQDINSMRSSIIEELSKNGKVTVAENKRVSQQLETYHTRYGFSWALAMMDRVTSKYGVRAGRKLYLSMPFTGNFIEHLKKKRYFYNRGYKNIGLSLKIVKSKIQLLAVLF